MFRDCTINNVPNQKISAGRGKRIYNFWTNFELINQASNLIKRKSTGLGKLV